MTNEKREKMVVLMERLHAIKKYRTETLYQAVNLADRYLARFLVNGQEALCMMTLAVTCLLIAAKLGEALAPSFNRMVNILKE